MLFLHAGHESLDAAHVLRWWTWDPAVLVCGLLSIALYARGARHAGIRWWEATSFGAGWLTVAIALLSPVDKLSDILFSAHMTQHELLMVIAAPLIVLGRPMIASLWGLPAPLRERAIGVSRHAAVKRSWRGMTGPIVVLLLHAVALWMWHIPSLFEAALRNDNIHAVQHLMFFITAALFWWALIHGRYGRVGYGVAVFFVFATAMHTSVLGAALTFAGRLWYPMYASRGAAWGVAPLEDQQLAGLIMWIPAGVIFIVCALALFAAWLGESERRVRIAEGERGIR